MAKKPAFDPVLMKADGTVEPFPPANGKFYKLEEMQKGVGGYIEPVSLSAGGLLIVNEEGKLNGLPVNVRATEKFQALYGPTDVIVGDAIFCPDSMLR